MDYQGFKKPELRAQSNVTRSLFQDKETLYFYIA